MPVLSLWHETLTKPKIEISMADQMIVALPVIIIFLIILVYFWLKEK